MILKQQYNLILLTLCALTSQTYALETQKVIDNAALVVPAVLLIGDQMGAEISTRSVTNALNTEQRDIGTALALTTFVYGVSMMLPKDYAQTKQVCNVLSKTVLTAGAARILTTTQRFNTIMSKIPFLNRYFSCHNGQCKGVCNTCKGIKFFLSDAATVIGSYFYNNNKFNYGS